MHCFKKRHDITFKKIQGSKAEANINDIQTWKATHLKRIRSDYPDKDIYNADETAFYYRMLPSATMTIDDITPITFKTRKEKVSLPLCTNMDGSDKLIPLVIGKYKKPRCFKSQSILPVKYT